jgi:hypothetical protein
MDMNILNRKNFLRSAASSVTGMILLPGIFKTNTRAQQNWPDLDPVLVKEFVGAAHKDIEKVKSMLEEKADLLNSVNNLGGWDWEDAIGAAGHVGIPELALYLLDKGARPTICVAAMLGKTEVVRTYITAFPYMKDAVGPHKISLVRHAKAGGDNAREVLEYLQSVGARE